VYILDAFLYFVDRILTGIYNGNPRNRSKKLRILDVMGPFRKSEDLSVDDELNSFGMDGLSKHRQANILEALYGVRKADAVFSSCRPHYPREHFHYKVVHTEDLRLQLKRTGVIHFSMERAHNIKTALESYEDECISFSQFCLILHSQTKEEQSLRWSIAPQIQRHKSPSMSNLYLLTDDDDDDDNDDNDCLLVKINYDSNDKDAEVEVC